MASIYKQFILPTPPPPTIEIGYRHFVPRWGIGNGGWLFDQSPSGFVNKTEYHGGSPTYGTDSIMIPIDALTAISQGLVEPQDLGYPPGILAAFLLLKGNS